ncbi:MAG: hypothetical protein CVU11_10350 [Bacteroidetes bacterium HGW-Bacteroidetes-6]|jgi:hypothetical protein|nr:MAG: hypothetical protein CVU11_10350 [Bacteroidetes bacterium HGW-Bacteroidetes-6]
MNTTESNSQILIPTLLAPPSAFYAKLISASKAITDFNETWPKQTLRNRYFIGGPNHTQMLVVPVHKTHGHNTPTCDIGIDYNGWTDYHRKSLITAYSKSPFFLYYADYIFAEFGKKHQRLIDLNSAIDKLILNWLNIKTEIEKAIDFVRDFEQGINLRSEFKYCDSWQLKNSYYQPFSERFGFRNNLSVFDLLFNLGPEASLHLKKENDYDKIQNS